MKTAQFKNRRGFTLIELLVVIGILAVLLAITLIAINPARQFQQANDTKRSSDVNAILNAIGQYSADHKGQLPTGLDATACPAATPCAITGVVASGNIDLCGPLVTDYIAGMPTDPLSADDGNPVTTCNVTYETGYTVSVGAADDRVTITAPLTEQATTDITVTR